MSQKEWVIADKAPGERLRRFQGFSPIMAQTLLNRGFDKPAAAHKFIHHSDPKSDLEEEEYDPSLMQGMKKAVKRINRAIAENQLIAVYGDFDADGVCATALMMQALNALGANATYYIPDRAAEGYGLNIPALQRLADNGVKLVITVDCGIRSVAEVDAGKHAGLDIIVTDHHTVGPVLPPALAVINPQREGCPGEARMAGVGVAFMLAQALLKHRWENDRANYPPNLRLSDLLDLVAIGTVADVMPLNVSLNRRLVHHGLKTINEMRRPGLKALAAVAGLKPGSITASDIAFRLGPRINAAGRLDSATPAYELLSATSLEAALPLADKLQRLNMERQGQTRKANLTIRGLVLKESLDDILQLAIYWEQLNLEKAALTSEADSRTSQQVKNKRFEKINQLATELKELKPRWQALIHETQKAITIRGLVLNGSLDEVLQLAITLKRLDAEKTALTFIVDSTTSQQVKDKSSNEKAKQRATELGELRARWQALIREAQEAINERIKQLETELEKLKTQWQALIYKAQETDIIRRLVLNGSLDNILQLATELEELGAKRQALICKAQKTDTTRELVLNESLGDISQLALDLKRLDSEKTALAITLKQLDSEKTALTSEADSTTSQQVKDECFEKIKQLETKLEELKAPWQELISKQLAEASRLSLIFAGDVDIKAGIVGLVAGRLVEEFYRPAVVMEIGEGESRASCRSIPEFDITRALDECADLLVRHGGHAMAAGFTVKNDNIGLLQEKLREKAEASLAGKKLRPQLHIDCEIDLRDLSQDLLDELDQLEPTGHENPPVVFMTRNLKVVNRRRVGADGNHLKLTLLHEGSTAIDAIGFGLGQLAETLPERIDAAYHAEINEWNGKRNLQMRLLDIRRPAARVNITALDLALA